MGEEVQSEKVCCATARSWARFIGWVFIILSVILLVLGILDFCGVVKIDSEADKKGSSNPESRNFVVAFLKDPLVEFVTLVGVMILSFVGGIVLVKGVSQGSPSKLKCWLIIEGISFAWGILESILTFGSLNSGEVVGIIISIPISLFCIWVVNLHRKELIRHFSRMELPI